MHIPGYCPDVLIKHVWIKFRVFHIWKKNSKCFWSSYLVRALSFFVFFFRWSKNFKSNFWYLFIYLLFLLFFSSLISLFRCRSFNSGFLSLTLFWILSFLPLFLFIQRCNFPIRPKLNLGNLSFPWYCPLFFFIFKGNAIYLFICFGCVGSSFLCEGFL